MPVELQSTVAVETDPAPEPEPAPTAEPVQEGAPPAAEADGADPDQAGGATPSFESLDDALAEIEKLRRENGKRRIQNKQLDLLSPEEQEAALAMFEKIGTNPAEARDQVKEVLARLDAKLGITEEPAPVSTEEPKPEEPAALTQEDVDRIVAEKLAAAEEERVMGELRQQAVGLGYDASSPDYGHLLAHAAAAEDGGAVDPITAAHEKILGDIKAIQDAAVEAYKEGLNDPNRPVTGNTSTSTLPPQPGKNTGLPDRDLKDWGAAARAAKAFREAQEAGLAG